MEIKMKRKDELEAIIDKKLIYPVFQPIVSLRTGEVHGYEALSRMIQPRKIKNTEDRFRKEVKEQWEKHQIQKDSYYDIVISYIKDYVENVYNKKKDKKKPKLNFKNDKKIQDFINSLESIKHKLVNLDLKTS